MSSYSVKIAIEFGKTLPTFKNFEEARESLLREKNHILFAFETEIADTANLDFSLDSLKTLEKWYFDNDRPIETKGGVNVVLGIGFYFGEVLKRVAGYEWVVEEYVFRNGSYEVGVKKSLTTIMLTKGKSPETQNNKRKQSLYRDAKRWL